MAVACDKVLADTSFSARGRATVFPQQPWTMGMQYRRELHKYLLRRLRCPHDLDDIKQEVYMRLLRMECMDYVREPLAYLYSVAASAVADFMLAEQRRQHVTLNNDVVDSWAEDLHQALPDDMAERISFERQLEKALNQLPYAQAAALIYHYQDGLSCDETAKKLGLSAKSVDKYLTRAKARMRVILAECQQRGDRRSQAR